MNGSFRSKAVRPSLSRHPTVRKRLSTSCSALTLQLLGRGAILPSGWGVTASSPLCWPPYESSPAAETRITVPSKWGVSAPRVQTPPGGHSVGAPALPAPPTTRVREPPDPAGAAPPAPPPAQRFVPRAAQLRAAATRGRCGAGGGRRGLACGLQPFLSRLSPLLLRRGPRLGPHGLSAERTRAAGRIGGRGPRGRLHSRLPFRASQGTPPGSPARSVLLPDPCLPPPSPAVVSATDPWRAVVSLCPVGVLSAPGETSPKSRSSLRRNTYFAQISSL